MTHSSYPNLTGSPRGEKEGDTPEVGIQGLVLNRYFEKLVFTGFAK